MGKQVDTQTVAPVWIVAVDDDGADGWLKGFRMYADGAPEIACTTHAQRSGYRDAMNADAACQVIDVMAANGKGDAEFDVFLSSIEDDHYWIRTGC